MISITAVIRVLGIGLVFIYPLLARENPRLDFACGVLAEVRGDHAEALMQFEKARAEDPAAMPLVRRAVSARLADGDRSSAVKLYRALATARPDDLEIQLAYADFLDQQSYGDALAMKLATDVLETSLVKNPGNPQLIRRLFQHAQTPANKPHQIELIGQLLPDDPESVLLYASLSRSVFDPEDAAAREKLDRRFLRAAEAHPEIPALARAASDHFRDTKRTDQAISILKRHVEAAPSSLELRTRLGILYFTAKRDAEGEAALNAVLAIDPRQALAHQSLAKFYRLRDKPDLARHHAGEVLKIRGGSPSEFINLADAWLAADDPRQARLLLERAAFDHPGNPELANKLAIATRRDPQTRDLAARLFREAEAVQPADGKTEPAFLIESAEALIANGQSKAAEERLRAAIKSYAPGEKKKSAAALRRLALLWESESRNASAAHALRQRADALDH